MEYVLRSASDQLLSEFWDFIVGSLFVSQCLAMAPDPWVAPIHRGPPAHDATASSFPIILALLAVWCGGNWNVGAQAD